MRKYAPHRVKLDAVSHRLQAVACQLARRVGSHPQPAPGSTRGLSSAPRTTSEDVSDILDDPRLICPEGRVSSLNKSNPIQSVLWFHILPSPGNMELWPEICCCWHHPLWVSSGSALVPCPGVSLVWWDCNSRTIFANSPTVASTLVAVLSSLSILAFMASAALAPISTPLCVSQERGPDWLLVAASGLGISTGKDYPSSGWRSIRKSPAFPTQDGAGAPHWTSSALNFGTVHPAIPMVEIRADHLPAIPHQSSNFSVWGP